MVNSIDPWNQFLFTDTFEEGTAPYDPYADENIYAMAQEIALGFIERYTPMMSPRPTTLAYMPSTIVGWSPPPHPVDVIVSFNPHASKAEQAAAVLLDYYHDNQLRSWADDGNVKKCFIGGNSPAKENHDPLLLVAAHANPKHKVWQCAGVTWKALDDAVQGAISRRTKLGPLPKSSYDTNPIVIYYYDNDTMKRITYPLAAVPDALNPENATGARYWAMYNGPGDEAHVDAGLEKVHTLQTNDPRKIKIERENPGWKNQAELKKILAKYSSTFQHSGDCPTCKGTLGMGSIKAGSAGGWDDEGFDWDRDVAGTGIIGSITGAILALVSAVLTATGVGAVVGVPLGIATPVIVAAINDLDVGLHTGDFGAGIAGLATAIATAATSAAGGAGISLPPAAMKALASAVTAVSNSVRAGEQKKLDFGKIWDNTAKQVSGHKLGDDEAIAIAQMLSGQGPAAGHVFIQGYLAGKFLDAKGIDGIAKLMKGMAVFADPRIINLGLLGMGFGQVAKKQGYTSFAPSKSSGTAPQPQQHAAPSRARGHATHGEFVGLSAKDRLHAFVQERLMPRYTQHATSGPYDVADDIHQDERIEAAQGLLNQLRGARPGDVLFLSSTGILDAPTRAAMRSFQFEAGVGSYDGMPTTETLLALEAEVQRKANILSGANLTPFVTGVGLDMVVIEGTLLYDAPNGHPISIVSERTRAMFVQRVGHWLQVSIDGTPVWIPDSTWVNEPVHAIPSEHDVLHALHGGHATGFDWPWIDVPLTPRTSLHTRTDPASLRAIPGEMVDSWLHDYIVPAEHAVEHFFTGQTSLTPPPDYGALSRGCPTGSWWDPFTSTCRAAAPLPMPPKPQPMPGPPNPMPLPVSPEMPTPTVSGWFYYPG